MKILKFKIKSFIFSVFASKERKRLGRELMDLYPSLCSGAQFIIVGLLRKGINKECKKCVENCIQRHIKNWKSWGKKPIPRDELEKIRKIFS